MSLPAPLPFPAPNECADQAQRASRMPRGAGDPWCPHVAACSSAVGLRVGERQHVSVSLCGCQWVCLRLVCVTGSRWRCGCVNPFVSLSPAGGGLSSCRLQLGNPSQ